MARPYSTPREKVWDKVIKQLVAQVFNLVCKSSHDDSNGNRQSKTCVFFFALARLISTVFQLMTQDTQCTSHASNSLSTQTEILNFLVNQVSCD